MAKEDDRAKIFGALAHISLPFVHSGCSPAPSSAPSRRCVVCASAHSRTLPRIRWREFGTQNSPSLPFHTSLVQNIRFPNPRSQGLRAAESTRYFSAAATGASVYEGVASWGADARAICRERISTTNGISGNHTFFPVPSAVCAPHPPCHLPPPLCAQATTTSSSLAAARAAMSPPSRPPSSA